MDIEAGDYVRLYHEEAGGLTALVARPHQVELVFYDTQGNIISKQVPVRRTGDRETANRIEPRTASTLLNRDRRLFSLGWDSSKGKPFSQLAVLGFNREGLPAGEEMTLFAEFVESIIDSLGVVPGDVRVSTTERYSFLDNITGTGEGRLLFSEDFEDFDTNGGWAGYDYFFCFRLDEDLSWQNFELGVTVVYEGESLYSSESLNFGFGRVRNEGESLLLLTLKQLNMTFRYSVKGLNSIVKFSEDWTGPLPIPRGVPFRVRLGVVDRIPHVSFQTSELVPTIAVDDGQSPWSVLVAIGDGSGGGI